VKTYSIDELPELKAQLGKARTDRVRYHQRGTGRRQAGAANIPNPLYEELLWATRIPSGAEDILFGIVRSIPGGDKDMSITRLWNLLQTLPLINTREVQLLMDLNQRQAQRYVQAAKMALPLLQKHFAREPLPEELQQLPEY